ncbi:hypothetical protein [Limnohabitans sp.]|uniref:hypothetical protein n=1 Tax=Limnohabitans sp. TaxID=1907725 RepID=UPI0033414469
MKRLQLYYWYIGVPVALVFLGAFVFWDAIISTVEGNPHPQINYIIFFLVVVGCYQMLSHVWRINKEGALFRKYRHMVESGISDEELDQSLADIQKKHDIVPMMQLIQALRDQDLTPVQHAAIESEMARFSARQNRRLMMSQFMGGLMVGMGLLGTFIGLLGALAEIGKLIGSFDLGSGMVDPVAAISELVARLTAPMQAMGVAFSASLFGVLGSLIMGVLSVGVRSASSDLVSFVQSDTSLMIDITHANKDAAQVNAMSDALGALAEHSPLLRSLALALDHSERRVRELVSAMGVLASRTETNNHGTANLIQQISQQSEQQAQMLGVISQLHLSHNQLAERQAQMADAHTHIAQSLDRQIHVIENAFDHQAEQNDQHAQAQQNVWTEQARLQGEMLAKQAENFEALLKAQIEESAAQIRAQSTLWKTYLDQQLKMYKASEESQSTQLHLAEQNRKGQWVQCAQSLESGLKQLIDHQNQSQQALAQYAGQTTRMSEQIHSESQRQTRIQEDMAAFMAQQGKSQIQEMEANRTFLMRIESLLQENQLRHAQTLAHLQQLASGPQK